MMDLMDLLRAALDHYQDVRGNCSICEWCHQFVQKHEEAMAAIEAGDTISLDELRKGLGR